MFWEFWGDRTYPQLPQPGVALPPGSIGTMVPAPAGTDPRPAPLVPPGIAPPPGVAVPPGGAPPAGASTAPPGAR
jgi:hypothetical protein